MNSRVRRIVAGAITVLTVAGAVWLIAEAPRQVPDITLQAIDGRSIRLAELRGQPVLITFWATTCPGCRREIPHFIDLYEQFHGRGFEIIGVAMHYDPPNRVVELVRQRRIPYIITLDTRAVAARAFGDVRLTPTSFLIAPDGRILHRKTGEFSTAELAALRVRLNSLLNGKSG